MTVEPPLSAAAQLTPAYLIVQCVAAQCVASQSDAASTPAMTVEPSSSTPTHLPAVQFTCSVLQRSMLQSNMCCSAKAMTVQPSSSTAKHLPAVQVICSVLQRSILQRRMCFSAPAMTVEPSSSSATQLTAAPAAAASARDMGDAVRPALAAAAASTVSSRGCARAEEEAKGEEAEMLLGRLGSGCAVSCCGVCNVCVCVCVCVCNMMSCCGTVVKSHGTQAGEHATHSHRISLNLSTMEAPFRQTAMQGRGRNAGCLAMHVWRCCARQ